jgi:hypothetical protein
MCNRLIYLAAPFSSNNPAVCEQRFHAVCRHAASMMKKGQHVFSPLSHGYGLACYGLPTDWSFWEAYDRTMLSFCAELMVLMLDGWKESIGVQAEIAIARELGKPVSFVYPE